MGGGGRGQKANKAPIQHVHEQDDTAVCSFDLFLVRNIF